MERAQILRAEAVSRFIGPAMGRLGALFGGLGEALEKARRAADLAAMDDRMLADIGMRRSDIPALFTGSARPNVVSVNPAPAGKRGRSKAKAAA